MFYVLLVILVLEGEPVSQSFIFTTQDACEDAKGDITNVYGESINYIDCLLQFEEGR